MDTPRSYLAAGAMGLGLAIAAVPTAALAQAAAPEEITVTGRYGTVPSSVQSLSQTVSYADLDIGTEAGRKVLRQRVSLTARYLCDKLGEPRVATPPAPACRDAATKDALARVETAKAWTAPRGTTWVRGPAWTAPYPADWPTRYP